MLLGLTHMATACIINQTESLDAHGCTQTAVVNTTAASHFRDRILQMIQPTQVGFVRGPDGLTEPLFLFSKDSVRT